MVNVESLLQPVQYCKISERVFRRKIATYTGQKLKSVQPSLSAIAIIISVSFHCCKWATVRARLTKDLGQQLSLLPGGLPLPQLLCLQGCSGRFHGNSTSHSFCCPMHAPRVHMAGVSRHTIMYKRNNRGREVCLGEPAKSFCGPETFVVFREDGQDLFGQGCQVADHCHCPPL